MNFRSDPFARLRRATQGGRFFRTDRYVEIEIRGGRIFSAATDLPDAARSVPERVKDVDRPDERQQPTRDVYVQRRAIEFRTPFLKRLVVPRNKNVNRRRGIRKHQDRRERHSDVIVVGANGRVSRMQKCIHERQQARARQVNETPGRTFEFGLIPTGQSYRATDRAQLTIAFQIRASTLFCPNARNEFINAFLHGVLKIGFAHAGIPVHRAGDDVLYFRKYVRLNAAVGPNGVYAIRLVDDPHVFDAVAVFQDYNVGAQH